MWRGESKRVVVKPREMLYAGTAAIAVAAIALALNGSVPTGEFQIGNPGPQVSRLPNQLNPALKK